MKIFLVGMTFYYLCNNILMLVIFVALSLLIVCCLFSTSFFFLSMRSRLGLRQETGYNTNNEAFKKTSQSRILCFVVTAIAKLATNHRELLPRARVSLGKVSFVTFLVFFQNNFLRQTSI